MRDKNRIPEILNRIAAVWSYCPDLRLGQLIENAIGSCNSLYYKEDEQLAQDLEEYINSVIMATTALEKDKNLRSY